MNNVDRRSKEERRMTMDRRKFNAPNYKESNRRKNLDRRSGKLRRKSI